MQDVVQAIEKELQEGIFYYSEGDFKAKLGDLMFLNKSNKWMLPPDYPAEGTYNLVFM